MVNRCVRYLAIVVPAIMVSLITLLPTPALALTGIFYQPQARDIQLPGEFWPKAMASVKQQGIDTVIVQWSRYGDTFASGPDRDWLLERAKDTTQGKLNLIMGLYADPDGFSAVEVSSDLLEGYFLRLHEKNLDLAKQWQPLIDTERLAGWYLPFEIDDKRWRSREDQAVLAKQLKRMVTQIQRIDDKPVYISAFFGGYSTPDQFARFIQALSAATGLKIWVQDGRGGARVPASATRQYLDALTDCSAPAAAGLVYELFRQTTEGDAFAAKPLAPGLLRRVLAQRAPCNLDSVYFSLRYLVPFGQ